MMNTNQAIALGEQLKERGIQLASTGREKLSWELQLAFLERLFQSPELGLTLDAAVADLGEKFPQGGKWRGPAIRHLARLRLIEHTGFAMSIRPSRHRGPLSTWRAVDLTAIAAKMNELRRLIDALNQSDVAQTTLIQDTTGSTVAAAEPVI